MLASTSKADAPTVGRSVLPSELGKCTDCKETHPLWRCPVLRRKTRTQKAKAVADNNLCFSCLNRQHFFWKCPKPRKCTAERYSSSHNVLVQGAEKDFWHRPLSWQNNATKNSSVLVKKESRKSSGLVSQTNVKGLSQILEVKLPSPTKTATILALCDSACSHSWTSDKWAIKLLVQGTATKLTVLGFISQEVVDTQMVQLKFLLVHSGDSECSTFDVKPFVGKHLSVENDFIDVDGLKQQYPHLESTPLKRYNYANVEMILDQDIFQVIRPLDYFETDPKGTAIAVQIPLGWDLSGPLPSTSGLFSTCFKAVTQLDNDFTLANQIQRWFEMKSFGAFKQVDPRSASDARGQKVLKHTIYDDGCRYQVSVLWANDRISLPND